MVLSIVLFIALSSVDTIQIPKDQLPPPPQSPTPIEVTTPPDPKVCPVTPYLPGAGEPYRTCVHRLNLVV